MRNNLDPIDFNLIQGEKMYFVTTDQYGGGNFYVFTGNGLDVLEHLKDRFHYEFWVIDNEDSSFTEFLDDADSANGEGYDFIQIYEIEHYIGGDGGRDMEVIIAEESEFAELKAAGKIPVLMTWEEFVNMKREQL